MLHVQADDLLFVDVSPGIESRLLVARPTAGVFAMQFRAQSFVTSPLHRHRNGVLGYTLSGRWRHDARYLFRPGTMICKTPGVIHRFVNGPKVTGAIFIGDPDLDLIDPVTLEVMGHCDGVKIMEQYVASCRVKGAADPSFL